MQNSLFIVIKIFLLTLCSLTVTCAYAEEWPSEVKDVMSTNCLQGCNDRYDQVINDNKNKPDIVQRVEALRPYCKPICECGTKAFTSAVNYENYKTDPVKYNPEMLKTMKTKCHPSKFVKGHK